MRSVCLFSSGHINRWPLALQKTGLKEIQSGPLVFFPRVQKSIIGVKPILPSLGVDGQGSTGGAGCPGFVGVDGPESDGPPGSEGDKDMVIITSDPMGEFGLRADLTTSTGKMMWPNCSPTSSTVGMNCKVDVKSLTRKTNFSRVFTMRKRNISSWRVFS